MFQSQDNGERGRKKEGRKEGKEGRKEGREGGREGKERKGRKKERKEGEREESHTIDNHMGLNEVSVLIGEIEGYRRKS